jgi:hypothetical protein
MMAREIFVAMFGDLAPAEAAARALERGGISEGDIELCARGAAGGALWEWLFTREPLYFRHVEDGGALLAVRAEGDAYDTIASQLLRHDLRTRTDLVQDKTSQSARVRRYAVDEATLSS